MFSCTRGLLALVGGGILSAAVVLAVRSMLPKVGGLHEDPHVVVAGYAAALSIVYGVLLAFTVVVVWEQMNKTRRLVEDEANRLADLWRLVSRFDGQPADQLREGLRQYALITRAEWQNEIAGDDDRDPAGASLATFWQALIATGPRTRGEQIVHGHVLKQFEEFSRVRSERRLSDSERLHPVMWLLLVAGAVATIGSMFFFTVQEVWIQGMLSALVGGVLGFTMFVIHDLDDPFDGVWYVGPAPIERAVGLAAS
jgi:hypothetical protein